MDSTTLRTPEGVVFQLPLAGLGSRFIGGLWDAFLQIGLYLLVMAATGDPLDGEGGFGAAVAAVAAFIIFFGYQFLCEAFLNGRTLGKRMAGLRVVNMQGGPISVRQSAVRNIVRIVDMLPGTYLLGMVSLGTSPRSQRIGDLAAGTFVVVEPGGRRFRRKRREAERRVGTVLDQSANLRLSQDVVDELATWDVINITREDIGIVRRFLARRSSLDMTTRARIADEFAAKLRPHVHGVDPDLRSERFLELLVEAKQIRR